MSGSQKSSVVGQVWNHKAREHFSPIFSQSFQVYPPPSQTDFLTFSISPDIQFADFWVCTHTASCFEKIVCRGRGGGVGQISEFADHKTLQCKWHAADVRLESLVLPFVFRRRVTWRACVLHWQCSCHSDDDPLLPWTGWVTCTFLDGHPCTRVRGGGTG